MSDFDPDAFLAGSQATATADFDPDTFLGIEKEKKKEGFDPNSFLGLKEEKPSAVQSRLSGAVSRGRAFLEGAGIPTSVEGAKELGKFLIRNPVQDVKEIAQDISQIPGRVRNIGQTISKSPAADVYRDPLSVQSFGTYGAIAGMVGPKVLESVKGAKPTVEVPETETATPATEPPETQPQPAPLFKQTPSGPAPIETPKVDPAAVSEANVEAQKAIAETPPVQKDVTSTQNAVVEQEMEKRGFQPIVQEATRDFGKVWDEAGQTEDHDPTVGERLIAEINKKPRALTDAENALLLRKQISAQAEFDAAVDAVNQATDPVAKTDAATRLSTARDTLQAVYEADKRAGRATGQGLNARKMLATKNYTLARMEAQRRAANGGEPLNPKQLAQVKELHDKIAELQAKVDSHEQLAAARQTFQKVIDAGREEARIAKATKKTFAGFLDEQAAKARQRIVARRGQLNVGLDPTALADEAIIGASHIARGVTKFADWSTQMLMEFGERIRPYLRDLWERARLYHAATSKEHADVRLQRYKTGLEKRTAELARKIEAKEFTKAQRQKTELDAEAFRMRAEHQRLKNQFDTMVERERLKNRPFIERAADTFVRAERASKLTGITTLGKLGGAFVTRMVTTPVEEAVGTVLAKLTPLRMVAEKAPREGAMSLRAEMKAATSGIAKGVKNIPGVLKGEIPAEEALYGRKASNVTGEYGYGSVLDIPGRAHGAIKSIPKEVERVRATTKREQFARKHGLDPNDPRVQQQIGEAADQDAKRSIFMQDNVISDFWRNGIRILENSKRAPTSGFIFSKIGQFLLPIVKVPTNVALETMTHLTGGLTATGKLVQVMSRGFKTIRPEEADMIMRHYKKGMIGAGLFFTGYFNASHFGGFYQPNQRNRQDVPWGAVRVNGVNIPAWLLHAPAFLVMQAGATAYKVQHRVTRGTTKDAALTVAKGLADEIPFLNEMGRIDKLLSDNWEGTKERGELLSGSTVPMFLRNVAQFTDKDASGNVIKRKPKTETDYLKRDVPGLRQQLQQR